jgi:Uma2 family endonuclease
MAMFVSETRGPLHLGRADRGRALTDEEFVEAFDDGPWRDELVAGKLVVMSPNSEEHDDATEPWRDDLVASKLANRGRIRQVVSEAWVKAGTGQRRIGDLGIDLHGSRSGIRRPQRAPERMLEIVSRGEKNQRRDPVEPRANQHAIAIWDYVGVEPVARKVTVFRHRPADDARSVLAAGDVYTTPLLPGLAIPLDEVF